MHYNWNKTAPLIVTWRSLNNSVHFNLLRFKQRTWNWARCGQRQQTQTLGLYLSVWSISTLPVTALLLPLQQRVKWGECVWLWLTAWECHLAAAVIRSVRGLGLYLTAHALSLSVTVVSLQCAHVKLHDDDNLNWLFSYLFIAARSKVGENSDFRVNNHYVLNLVTSV